MKALVKLAWLEKLSAQRDVHQRSVALRQKGVRTENLNPGVVVMESAQDLERFDAPGPLNRARNRRILVQ